MQTYNVNPASLTIVVIGALELASLVIVAFAIGTAVGFGQKKTSTSAAEVLAPAHTVHLFQSVDVR